MTAKVIQVSDDNGATWYTLPGASGELSREGSVIDDTVFGQSFKSEDSGTKSWSINGAAYYKGFPGYKATIKYPTSETVASGEAMEVVSGKTYKITNAAKNCWDKSYTMTVKIGNIASYDVTDQVESFNHLFGQITFLTAYSPTAAVWIDCKFHTFADLGKAQGYQLTMQTDAIQTTDFPTVTANGGWHTHSAGLRTVALTLDNVYATTNPAGTQLENNTTVLVEINPDGQSKSRARGYFRVINAKQSGNVGALELENVSLSLNVPNTSSDQHEPQYPFKWDHASDTTLATSIRKCLTAFEGQTLVDVQYLHDGTNGAKGDAVVTDISLSGGLESMNQFTANFMGSGALTDVP